jgi:hypothetical protein
VFAYLVARSQAQTIAAFTLVERSRAAWFVNRRVDNRTAREEWRGVGCAEALGRVGSMSIKLNKRQSAIVRTLLPLHEYAFDVKLFACRRFSCCRFWSQLSAASWARSPYSAY